jgi:murein DD-endopeptidase MepM/ murein hydrolase activator NlpD
VLELELKGYVTSKTMPEHFVIPPKTERYLLAELNITYKGDAEYSFRSMSWMGDFDAVHNKDYVYSLPFEKDKSFVLSQGYDGKITHQNSYELDFTMVEGTPVYAAGDGKVILTKNDSMLVALLQSTKTLVITSQFSMKMAQW